LESTNGYVGANGVVKMSPKDHLGLDFNAFRMVEIQSGEWMPIE
jgi:branched-chain amino acid transport system substrate-binding protein